MPRRGSIEITVAARKKDADGKYTYQLKWKDGALYKEGEWVPQEKLSEI